MTLQDLVCTTEQSLKFAEIGLFEDSVFVFGSLKYAESNSIYLRGHCDYTTGPAPTAQEICKEMIELVKRMNVDYLNIHYTERWRLAGIPSQGDVVKIIYKAFLLPEPAGYLASAILQITEEDENQKNQQSQAD